MEKWKSASSLVLLCGLLSGCPQLNINTNPTGGSPAGGISTSTPNRPAGNTAVVLTGSFTDAFGAVSLLTIDAPRTATNAVQSTHSDGVIHGFDNKLYVVNRLGADNIQLVDPANNFDAFDCSVGSGTNPQEMILISSSKAYVTLYQPEDNNDNRISVDDVLVVDPRALEAGDCSTFITKSVDLTPLTGDDGQRFARASAMVLVGTRLFVALQDLDPDFSPPNQPGKIAVIDTAADTVIAVITLDGRDPVAMDHSTQTGLIYISNAFFADINSPFGGIEVVDPSALATRGMVVSQGEIGATPGDIEAGASRIFVTASSLNPGVGTKVVSFNPDPDAAPDVQTLYQSDGFINDIAIDQNGRLLVGDRNPQVNGVLFLDPATGATVDGPFTLGAGPSSITFMER